VKKGIEINKDVLKRVSSTKETREFTISERTKSTNKYQAAADFVASQKRTSNTKGQESELAKDWDRFSDKGSSSVATPATKSNTQDKPKQRKLTPAQRAQIEAHKLAQKKALRPASTSIISEASSDSPAKSNLKLEGVRPSGEGSVRLSGEDASDAGAGNAAMGHQADGKAGSASLQGEAAAEVDAGNASMGHHADAAAGNAAMGHQTDTKAGFASLQGETAAEVDAGSASMGHHADAAAGNAAMDHQTDTKAGFASLQGETAAEVDAGNASMGHHADAAAGNAAMGHQTDAKAGNAAMGHQADANAGNAAMGHQADANAGFASLQGGAAAEVDAGNADMGHQVSKQAGETLLNEKTVLSSRLAEKMSKILSQSADITMDSKALQERSDKS
jgi:hypothetical protein